VIPRWLRGTAAYTLDSPRRAWAWAAAAAAVSTVVLLGWLFHRHQQLSVSTVQAIESIRAARIELAAGFLHVTLGAAGDPVFERGQGLALLRQAAETLEEVLERPLGRQDVAQERATLLASLREKVTALERALGEAPGTGWAALRLAYAALDREAEHIDAFGQRQWREHAARVREELRLALVGAVLLLGTVFTGLLGASRERIRSEARFRQLFDEAPIGLAYVHRDGSVVRVNRRLTTMLGFERSDIPHLDDWWSKAYPEPIYRGEVRAGWEAAVATALREGREIARGVHRVATKQGAPREVEIGGIAVEDGILAVIEDVTERRRAEAALRAHEALLEETGRIAKIGGWSFDTATGQGDWSPEVARIHGLDPEAPTNRDVGLEFYRGDSRKRIEEAIAAAIERAEPYDLELELVTRDGERKWVRTIGHPVVEDGRVVRLRGSFQDITAIRRAHLALRENELRFRTLIENVSDLITVLDREGVVRFQSAAIEPTLGLRPEEVEGRGAFDLVHPEDVARAREAFARVADPDRPRGPVELRLRHRDGSWRTLQAIGREAELGELGTVVVLNSRDVTAQRELEARLLHSQRMEAVGTLAAGVAHDLNNILAPMTLVSGLLRDGLDDRELLQYVEIVENSARRGASIVQQLLSFSRAGQGERTSVELLRVLREMVLMMRETFPRNIEIVEQLAGDAWTVRGDATQLHQVVMNLCVNARDAMPDGGRLGLGLENCELDAEAVSTWPGLAPGPHVRLVVSDTGAGMPPEIQARVFDPFFTTKPPGRGSGLGLSVVLGIVRKHDGVIAIDSAPGAGTRVTVLLPAEPAGAVAAVATAEPVGGGHGEILLVDDEPAIRTVAQTMLEQAGYRVVVAGDGDEALARLEQPGSAPDLLLTDLAMPGMDGHALIRAVRERRRALPIVVSTGFGEEGAIDRLVLQGVVAVLHKPYRREDLLRVVARGLGRGGPAAGGS
jgi:PAS domain S-box-containing protein